MISLLLTVLVLVLIFGVLWYVVNLLPLPYPWPIIAQLVLLVLFVVVLVAYFLPAMQHPAVLR